MIAEISIRIIGFGSIRKFVFHFLTNLSLLVLFLFTQHAVSGEVLKAELVNEDKKFHEMHEPEVNVSGNVIVGVMSTSTFGALTENSIGIQSSKTGKKKICLKVTSRDGTYMSQNEYSVDVAAPTIIYLPYESNMMDIVNSYAKTPGAIAVSATNGDCDHSTTADFYLPARLDQENTTLKIDSLSIYINGFDATDVFYHIAGTDPDNTFDCDYIEEGRHTAYNFSCEIASELLAAPSLRDIQILREVYGRELKPVTIRLLSTR